MNQHLLVKIRQFGVANPGNSLAKAGPMSGAQPMNGAQPMSEANALAEANPLAAAIALGLTCDRRLELDGPALRHFPCAAE